MYRFRDALLPKCIGYMYKVNTAVYIYRHDTRQSSYYHVPVGRTNAVYSSLRYTGVEVYNNIVSSM